MDRNQYYGGESASLNLTQVRVALASLFVPLATRLSDAPRRSDPRPSRVLAVARDILVLNST